MGQLNHYSSNEGEYVFSTDPSLIDVNLVWTYLSKESYWATNIPFETVERSIRNSVSFGIYTGAGQVGFARVITDKATFAYLADVFIMEAYRGRGLSKKLLRFIDGHPELRGLRRWMLGTRDAHSLYLQFGWTQMDEATCGRFMQRHDKQVYT